MKFGGRQTVADKMAVAESRMGKNPGVSKGYTPPPKAKIKPKIGKDRIGLTYTQLLRGGRK
jgi:hypothetical protein